MTVIQVQHVVSCSSEDNLHKADNLLKGDSYKKWTCGAEGEKQASVILQLDKMSKIHSIDVGNESSAFVEILGGHSSAEKDDYQVILVTSSFMSPMESRSNTNQNRVRMFGPESLSKAVADKKFDRIKIVCTQPFNKRCKYGLSFIKFHGPPGSGEQQAGTSPGTAQTTLGKFKLKEESKSSLSVGSFFKNKDKEDSQKPLTGAAAVRAAATLAATSTSTSPATTSKISSPQVHKQQQPVKRRLSEEDKRSSRDVAPSKKPHREDSATREPPVKKTRDSGEEPATGQAFGSLMRKVVFVMSGFQNPLRGDIRDKAIEMGAKYRGDWGTDCTHLVCAFANTPKYNQVKGKGKIVKKEWILDCYRKRKMLEWQRYKLSSGRDGSSDESESEEEEERKPIVKARPTPKESPKQKAPTPKKSPAPAAASKPADDEDMYGGSTDEEGNDTEPLDAESSGDDTEDEIRRIQTKPAQPSGVAGSDARITEKKVQGSSPTDIPELPDFFSNKRFMLFGKFDGEERRQINRFIVAFNGMVENYMNERVNYVITNSNWDTNFDEALSDNTNLTFVKPKWLFACNEKLKMVPFQPYIVVPAN